MSEYVHNTRLFRYATAAVAIAALLWIGDRCLASGHGASTEPVENIDESDAKNRGIQLGEFRIRSYYPVQARKSIVRFVLYATAQDGKFSATKRLVDSRLHKIRDQVITATRLVPLAELDEVELASFRRRILLRLRRTLPELAIKDIYVSDFDLKVQSL